MNFTRSIRMARAIRSRGAKCVSSVRSVIDFILYDPTDDYFRRKQIRNLGASRKLRFWPRKKDEVFFIQK